ncbi:MAG: hypothetical protein ACJ71S_06635 [Acidobacteriaceae bacterium]|jgi:hypothetical protein
MAIASSIQEEHKTLTSFLVWLALTFSGSYVVGGDTLDLTAVTNPNGFDIEGFFELPKSIGVFSENMGGYYCQIIPGATLQTYKIMVFAPGGAQLGAVTYASVGLTAAGIATLLATRRAM